MAYHSFRVLLGFIYVQGYLNPEHLLSPGNIVNLSEFLKWGGLLLPPCLLLRAGCSRGCGRQSSVITASLPPAGELRAQLSRETEGQRGHCSICLREGTRRSLVGRETENPLGWVGDCVHGRDVLWAAPDGGFAGGCAPELSSPLHKWKALSTEPKDCFSKAVWNSDQFSAFSGKPSCLWLSLELTWERKNNLEGAALWEGGLGHPESQRETVIWGGVLQNSQFYKCEAIFSGHWSKYVLDPGLVTFSVRSI